LLFENLNRFKKKYKFFTLNAEELIETVEQHRLWLEFGGQIGRRANLHKADLRDAGLGGADLYGVDVSEADITGAIIK
jgi:uncharacterized protein YjbI with pentapeptide repeats